MWRTFPWSRGRSMPSLVRILPVVWEENGDKQTNKQTDRQTDTPFCFIYIDLVEVNSMQPVYNVTQVALFYSLFLLCLYHYVHPSAHPPSASRRARECKALPPKLTEPRVQSLHSCMIHLKYSSTEKIVLFRKQAMNYFSYEKRDQAKKRSVCRFQGAIC